jgi:transglutaminase-like putative cysteine protease
MKNAFLRGCFSLVILPLVILTSCDAGSDANTSAADNVTLPTPVTSKTVPSFPDVNLDAPPISVVVPPVTTVTTTVTTTAPVTTADPLDSISRVPLGEYLGYETTAGTSGNGTGGNSTSGNSTGGNSTSGNGSSGTGTGGNGTDGTGTGGNSTGGNSSGTSGSETAATTVTVTEYTERYPERVIYRPYEYGALTPPQKQLYELMEDTFRNITNELTIPEDLGVTSADFDTVFALFLNKEPHDYYLVPSAKTSYSRTTDKLYSVTFTYMYPKVTITSRNERTDAALRTVLSGIKPGMTDFDKVKYFFDYLAEHITYDSSSDDSSNVYGALFDGRASCMGYSYAMKLLCNEAGIPAITVSGKNGADVAHMWNMVKIGSDWYLLDATFGDPDKGYINYDYFLTTDARIYSSYSAAETIRAYPNAVSMEDNYYVKNGLFASTKADAVSILNEKIAAAIDKKLTCVQILCATENVFINTEAALLGASSPENIVNAIMQINETKGNVLDIGKTSYMSNENSNVIKIVLVYN